MARKAGVSGPTVSRALSGSPLIPASTRERVKAVAEAMGYVPNRQAALFILKRTLRLGFVIPLYKAFPPFSRPYFPALLDGAVIKAEERGYSITIIMDRIGNEPKNLARLVQAKEVDGLLFAITKSGDERLKELGRKEIPLVLLNNLVKGCASVSNNPVTGMKQAFEYLKDMGHKRIGYISGDREYIDAVERLRAFNELASKYSMEATVLQGNFSKTSGYQCAGKLLNAEKPPTAIMTSSDREAVGVLNYCRDHRVPVPGRVSVIGYDNLDPTEFISPPLSTVMHPVREIGCEGADLLIDLIEKKKKGPIHLKLNTGFIVRESSGRVPGEEMKT